MDTQLNHHYRTWYTWRWTGADKFAHTSFNQLPVSEVWTHRWFFEFQLHKILRWEINIAKYFDDNRYD